MSRHTFNPDVAVQVGINAAVIYENILWWCERNAVKGRNIHDGNAWTFNSVSAFGKLFPYLTAKQIRTALDRLQDAGLLDVGNFNEDQRDRTKWYAPAKGTEAFARLVQLHLPARAQTFAREGEPLPDSKPDIKHTPIPPRGPDLFSANEEDSQEDERDSVEQGFEEFWTVIWPAHKRKIGKVDCAKVYRQACAGKHPKAPKIEPEELNRCARAYVASVRDAEFLKGPLPWLRLPGWEPFLGAKTAPRPMTYAQRVLAAHRAGGVA